MKKILLCILTVTLVGFGSIIFVLKKIDPLSGHKLYISGDESAINSVIYANGKEVGFMEKAVDTTNSLTYSNGISSNFKNMPDDKRPVYDMISLPRGSYHLTAISPSGKKLSKDINLETEEYLFISFEENEF